MRFFASRRAWRSACWQVGGSGRSLRVFGTRAQSPSAHTCSCPRTRRNSSTSHAALLVDRQRPLAQDGIRRDAGRPDDHVGGDLRPVPEHGLVGGDRLERGLDVDLDPALRQLGRRVVAEWRRDVGEDPRGRVDEHPPARRRAQARVVAECVLDEVRQFGERLDARVAGADEDERQPPRRSSSSSASSASLELLQDLVAEIDRIGERLEGEPVLREARDRQRPRHRAEGDDEVVQPIVCEPSAPRRSRSSPRGRERSTLPSRSSAWGHIRAAGTTSVPSARACPTPPPAAAVCRA